MREIKYTVFYCVCENFCDSIFLRFRFRQAKSYGSYSSGSATVHGTVLKLVQKYSYKV